MSTRPIPRPIRFLFAPLLGWLVYHANRRFRSESWYAVKDKVLSRWSTPDGCDLQVLPPNECWSCDKGVPRGCGPHSIRPNGRCARCDGEGHYTPERYVRLERRKLGPYVFHKPGSTATRNELAGIDAAYWARAWKAHSIIHGLILHAPTKRQRWLGYRTRIVLELLFDFKRFAPILLKRLFRRPLQWWHGHRTHWRYGCHWLQLPPWSPFHVGPDWRGLQDDDLPF